MQLEPKKLILLILPQSLSVMVNVASLFSDDRLESSCGNWSVRRGKKQMITDVFYQASNNRLSLDKADFAAVGELFLNMMKIKPSRP
jgi:hypothetical protein